MKKTVTVLGSTGSVGRQALEVARDLGYRVFGLSCDRNIKLLEDQIRAFSPAFASVRDEKKARELAVAVADTETKILSGDQGVSELASMPENDLVENSILGFAGILPTLCAIEAGNDLAVANKEPIVAAGEILLKRAREKGVRFLPVDSEHSAVFQCLSGSFNSGKFVDELVLTASGGPFFGKDSAFLATVTPAMAVAHPTWNMGKKISVDSASLLNKGLEIIEASRLFDIPADRIRVTVHRQSIVHSMVTFRDGSTLAQMGHPDMRHCVQFAFTYPERVKGLCRKLDFSESYQLTFEPADEKTFPLLAVSRRAALKGGTFTTVLNAANEAAVKLFLEEKISFPELFSIVEEAVETHSPLKDAGIDEIISLDFETKEKILARFGYSALKGSVK